MIPSPSPLYLLRWLSPPQAPCCHGLAYFETVEQMLQPPENYYAVSYLFTDITSIPFDDVDDIGALRALNLSPPQPLAPLIIPPRSSPRPSNTYASDILCVGVNQCRCQCRCRCI